MLDEDDRPLPPSSFLSVAERLGLISMIDSWVAEEAIRLVADQEKAGTSLTVNVNISGKSVGDPALMDVIDRTLRETQVNPARLVFEVTETAAIANLEEAKAFAEKAADARLPVRAGRLRHRLRILLLPEAHSLRLPEDRRRLHPRVQRQHDRHAGGGGDRRDCEGMGKKTVAEFVQSPLVAQQLRASGVNYAQGYQLGAPRPVSALFAA
jgi:EAL domain-containing protein (putative c-di-GMP-specific phosphodiesterase class I)